MALQQLAQPVDAAIATCAASATTAPRAALEPLEPTGAWDTGEPPETYPTAV